MDINQATLRAHLVLEHAIDNESSLRAEEAAVELWEATRVVRKLLRPFVTSSASAASDS